MYEIIVLTEIIENIKTAKELLDEAVRIDVEENNEEANMCRLLSPTLSSIDTILYILEDKLKQKEEIYVGEITI